MSLHDESASAARDGDGIDSPRWVQSLVALMLAAVIVTAIGLALLLALVHARDRYWINIASGSWLALAWSADHGALYPPLRDADGAFAGTRYMPLHIVMHAGLQRATGEWLFSGRAIAYTAALAWISAIVALARVRACPWLIAGALAASIVASPSGVQALCTIRSDGMALALQLWALWIISRCSRPASGTLAGILCALAFLAKLTAVWAAVAIALWLLWRNRTSLLAFLGVGALVAGGSLVAFNMLSEGRMLENFLHAGPSGWSGWGSVLSWSPRRIVEFVSQWSPTTWALVPPAALATLLAAARRDLNVLHLAWLACGAALAVMYADVGVGENHIIELAATTAIVAGDLWRRTDPSAVRRSDSDDANAQDERAIGGYPRSARSRWNAAHLLIALMIAWSSLAVMTQRLWNDAARAVAQWRSGQPAPNDDPAALDQLLSGATFLSDDPTLSILLDRKPLISDAFIFRGFQFSHSEWIDEVIARIQAREFQYIVLTREADPDSWWYRELFLGPRVVQAIRDSYTFDGPQAGYEIYRAPR